MPTTPLLRFPYPEPKPSKIRILPFFLPFAGCEQRCIFCNQHAQTGIKTLQWDSFLHNLRQLLSTGKPPFGLGFFGGTFTGLPQVWQQHFLTVAQEFRSQGLTQVRISTRPDRVSAENLDWLVQHGVDLVELGIQSFQTKVLHASKRGYTAQTAIQACNLVRAAGLSLGIQLLPGLPEHTARHWQLDVQETLALQPAVVRIYPCVVMAKTQLADRFRHGQFTPWTLDQAMDQCSWALRRFWEAGIQVIRLGLAHEPSFKTNLLAGPWHPAFGNMVRAATLCSFLEDKLTSLAIDKLFLPKHLQGDLWGYKQANVQRLQQLGLTKQNIHAWTAQDIGVKMKV